MLQNLIEMEALIIYLLKGEIFNDDKDISLIWGVSQTTCPTTWWNIPCKTYSGMKNLQNDTLIGC